jgi:hypothetical protein
MVRCTASLRSVLDLVTKARVSRPPRNIKLQIRCSKDWNQVVSKIGGSKTRGLISKEGLQMISASSLRKRILMREKERWKLWKDENGSKQKSTGLRQA